MTEQRMTGTGPRFAGLTTIARRINWRGARRAWAVLALTGLVLGTSDAARADATTEIYGDLRDVVEELITAEFAESSTAWLVCNTGILPQYYLGSLQRLTQRQWGQLKKTLRDDTIDASADYVYRVSLAVAKLGQDGAKNNPPSIDTLFKGVPDWTVTVDDKNVPLANACAIVNKIGDPNREKNRRAIVSAVKMNRFQRPTPIVDICDKDVGTSKDPNQPVDPNASVACSLARSVKAALQGKRGLAQAAILEFTTRAFVLTEQFPNQLELDKAKIAALHERLLAQLVGWLRADEQSSKLDSWIGTVLEATPDLQSGDLERCDDAMDISKVLRQMAANPTGVDTRQAFLCAITRPKALDWSGVKLHYEAQSKRYELGLADLLDLMSKIGAGPISPAPTADSIVTAVICQAKNDGQPSPLCIDGAVTKPGAGGPSPATVTIALGELSWKVTLASLKVAPVNAAPPLQDVAVNALRLRAGADKVVTAVRAFLGEKSTASIDDWIRPVARLVRRVRLLVDDFQHLRLFTDQGNPDYAELLDAALRAIRKSPRLCQQTARPTAAKKDQQAPAGNPDASKGDQQPPTAESNFCGPLVAIGDFLATHQSDVNAMLASAGKKDYRTLALQFLETLTPAEDKQEESCSLEKPPYRRLTITFVTYLLEETDEGAARTGVGREAFRTAAIEALRCTSTGGLNRTYEKFWGDGALHMLYRSAALRPSWNAAYHNQAGTDGYRTTVSLPAFTIHPRFTRANASTYAGLEISFVDYLAPLTELALRNVDTDYQNSGVLWLELIRPRVDLILGLPMLSEHLGVSAGASWRTAVPFRGAADQQASDAVLTANTYTYRSFVSKDDRVQRNYSAFLEFGFGVHYVF